MEMQINRGVKLSLEQMALRRVAANLWGELDILTSIENWRFKFLSEDSVCMWIETIENLIKVKIAKLVLPESLKKHLKYLVRPMGTDIMKWKMFHERMLSCVYFNRQILEQLCWTCAGTIDYRNTAERLAQLKIFATIDVYHLSCSYCLVDYISSIWEQIPECTRLIYYDREYALELKFIDVRFTWAFMLTAEESKLDHVFYQKAFKRAVDLCNKTATEYFFQKLPVEERDLCAFTAVGDFLKYRSREVDLHNSVSFPAEKGAEVINYLLSMMSEERQMMVLREYPCAVLKCFLTWPWQDLFLDIADIIWTFLPEDRYDNLISLLVPKLRYLYYNSPNFFLEFFHRSPSNFRKHFVFRLCLFSEFVTAEDTETIKEVLKSLDAEDRVMFVSSYPFFRLLDRLITKNKCHLVKFCLREATLSKEETQMLKEDFIGFVTGSNARTVRLRKRRWRAFFQFLNETDAIPLNKRSSEDEMLTKAKRPCCSSSNMD